MSPKEFKKSNIRNTLHTSPGILLRHSVPVELMMITIKVMMMRIVMMMIAVTVMMVTMDEYGC